MTDQHVEERIKRITREIGTLWAAIALLLVASFVDNRAFKAQIAELREELHRIERLANERTR